MNTASDRPKEVEAAWALTLVAIAGEAVVRVLGAFVVAPTGLDELTPPSGTGGAARQLALSGAILVVFSAGWLAVAVKMRAGRGWARTVLALAGAASVLFLAADLNMSGAGADDWALLAGVPDVLAATAAISMYLPAARAHFRSRPRRA